MIMEIIKTVVITIVVGSFVVIAINIGIICSFMNSNARYKKQIGGNYAQ
jgi:hypothetical protein